MSYTVKKIFRTIQEEGAIVASRGWFHIVVAHGLALLMAGATCAPVRAGDRDQPAVADAAVVRTGKERLTDKGSDEQRVNDCKVPQARRTRARPATC